MTTLDPRALEAAARELFESEENTAMVEYPEWDSPKNVGKPLYIEDAEAAITAYLAVAQPVVETVEELEGLPARTIIVDATGRARRWEGEYWTDATTESYTHEGLEHWGMLPARVIWRPHENP